MTERPASESSSDKPPIPAVLAPRLLAVVERLHGHSVEQIEELLYRKATDEDTLATAVDMLHRLVIGRQSTRQDSSDDLGLSYSERQPVLPPGSRSSHHLDKGRLLDAGAYSLDSMPARRQPIPHQDIFHHPADADLDDELPIYPALAAQFIKTVIGPSAARANLVTQLNERQLYDLVLYCCVVHKFRPEPNMSDHKIDNQNRRLLLHLSGITDNELIALDGGEAKTSTHIRRSRRLMIAFLRKHEGMITRQVMELLRDPDYRLAEDTPLYGFRMSSDVIDSIELSVQPVGRLTSRRMVSFAMRRYAAVELRDHRNDELRQEWVRQNLTVIWLRLNGLDRAEITDKTGVDETQQNAALERFFAEQRPELPTDKAFVRLIRQITEEAQAVLEPRDELTEIEIPSSTPEDVPTINEDEVLEFGDTVFQERIERILGKGQLILAIHRANQASSRWKDDMPCRHDRQSLVTEPNQRPTTEVLERCWSCPVRDICLFTSLSKVDINEENERIPYMHEAGLSPEERRSLLRRAGIETGGLQAALIELDRP